MLNENSEDLGLRIFPLAPHLAKALEGAVFPLDREAIIWVARENEAPSRLLTLLSQLPDRSYPSTDEIERALGM